MTEKRFFLIRKFLQKDKFHDIICHRFMNSKETEKTLNRLHGKYSLLKMENEQLKLRIKELETDVEYWKQVASQYSNELNVFEHCKKYKTECKDIYWDSD